MASRIKPSINVPARTPHETVYQLASLPADVEFAAMQVTRSRNDYWGPIGTVMTVWVEYIGARAALLTLPGILPAHFDAGKCGQRRHYDARGNSVWVHRYAGDRWRVRIDAGDFKTDADVAAAVATYWPEPVKVPLVDDSESVAVTRLHEAMANDECLAFGPIRSATAETLDALIAEIRRLLQRPEAREALRAATESKLSLSATLKLMRRAHLRLVVDNTRSA